jgi:hypothetical protein
MPGSASTDYNGENMAPKSKGSAKTHGVTSEKDPKPTDWHKSKKAYEAAMALPESVKSMQRYYAMEAQAKFMDKYKKEDYQNWVPTMTFGESSMNPHEVDAAVAARGASYVSIQSDLKQDLRYSFLEMCKRLNVPDNNWPEFGRVNVNDPGAIKIDMPPFTPPQFQVHLDDAQRWRKRARIAWVDYCKVCLNKIEHQIQRANLPGTQFLKSRPRTRTGGKNSPRDLRVEWAVRHRCLGWSYKKLWLNCNTGKRYSVDAITKSVQRLLGELGLELKK